jgi:hypothetical protein
MKRPQKKIRNRRFALSLDQIGKDGSSERKHADLLLNAVIRHVLENEEFGYKVKRADEDADPGMIGDRVITDIIKSSLVVADLTDLNPNAFYELGIRHSTELPTIHMARSGTALPFDNVTHRTIFVDLGDWRSIEQAREHLASSARAVKSSDYKVSNPITQANASFKMRQSEDPRDRALVSLQERLETLENSTSRLRPVVEEDHSYGHDHPSLVVLNRLAERVKKLRGAGLTNKQIETEIRTLGDSVGVRIAEFNLRNNSLRLESEDGCGLSMMAIPKAGLT